MRAIIGVMAAVAAGLLALGFYLQESLFQLSATTAMAEVVSVSAHNDRCGSSKNRYRCTKFGATLRYSAGTPERRLYSMNVSAGSARGHDQALRQADLHEGESVQILYDPDDPDDACRNTWGAIHTKSMMAFAACIASLFMGFAPARRRSVWT